MQIRSESKSIRPADDELVTNRFARAGLDHADLLARLVADHDDTIPIALFTSPYERIEVEPAELPRVPISITANADLVAREDVAIPHASEHAQIASTPTTPDSVLASTHAHASLTPPALGMHAHAGTAPGGTGMHARAGTAPGGTGMHAHAGTAHRDAEHAARRRASRQTSIVALPGRARRGGRLPVSPWAMLAAALTGAGAFALGAAVASLV